MPTETVIAKRQLHLINLKRRELNIQSRLTEPESAEWHHLRTKMRTMDKVMDILGFTWEESFYKRKQSE